MSPTPPPANANQAAAAAATTAAATGRTASAARAQDPAVAAAALAPAASSTTARPHLLPDAAPAPVTVPADATGLTELPAESAEPSRRGRLGYLEGLVEVAGALNTSLDLPTVVQVLVQRAAELLGVPGATVLLLGDDEHLGAPGLALPLPVARIAASHGLSLEYVAALQRSGSLAGSVAARALAEGRIFAAWDVRESQAVSPAEAEAARREGIASVACAPMFAAGRAVGTLNLYCRAPQQCFSPDQFDVLSLLAAQGAVAITNARLYARSRLQSQELQASFSRVGAALAASLDTAQTLKLIVQLAGEMTRADGGAMFMLEGTGEGQNAVLDDAHAMLLLSAARGLHRRSIRLFRRVPPSPLAARALAGRKVIVIPDTRRHPETPFPSLRTPGPDKTIGSDGDVGDKALPTRAAVYVPVLVGGRPVGVLEQYAVAPNHFNRNDVQLLESFALHAAVAIENARLYAQERDVARTLQRSFLPDLPDRMAGWEVGRIYMPASSQGAAVGGDTYDLLALPGGRVCALIADVSGHGLEAAGLTGLAKYTARAYALENPDPSSVLARLNNALCAQTGDSTFLTLCCALLEGKTPDRPFSRVTLANAAHPPALLCRADGSGCVALGGEPGLIAGFRPGETYPARSADLAPGDVVVLYTDGVVEARRRKTMFEQERLRKIVRENARRPAQEIAAAIYDAVAAYVAPAPLADDIALLVLKAP